MSVPQAAAVPIDRLDSSSLSPGNQCPTVDVVAPESGLTTGTLTGPTGNLLPVNPVPANPPPTQPVVASTPPPADALSVHELRLGMVVALVVLLVAGFQWWRLSRGGVWPVRVQFLKAENDHFQLDINQCHWAELTQLEGIGDALAQRIVAYRETHGPFQSVDDLSLVHGIGKKTVDAFRAHVRIGPLGSQTPAAPGPSHTTPETLP